jgi:hypothetical protein
MLKPRCHRLAVEERPGVYEIGGLNILKISLTFPQVFFPDPDPHQRDKLDPDPQPHQSYKLDPYLDPYQFADEAKMCGK